MSDLLLMRGSPLRQLLSTSGLVACYLPYMDVYGRNIANASPSLWNHSYNSTTKKLTRNENFTTGNARFTGDVINDTRSVLRVWVSKAEYDYCRVETRSGHTSSGWAWFVFDLTTGAVTDEQEGGCSSVINSKEIVWDGDMSAWRVTVDYTYLYTTAGSASIYGTPDGTYDYTGDGTSGMYVHQWQHNLGTTLYPYSAPEGLPQTVVDRSGNGNDRQLGSTAGVDADDPAWGAGGKWLTFDGVDDIIADGPSATTTWSLLGDPHGNALGWVRGKRTNVGGRMYAELRFNRVPTEAERVKLFRNVQTLLVGQGVTGTFYDWAYPIPCTTGVMDFSLKNGADRLWVAPDGTTSTVERPQFDLASNGTTWAYLSNWDAPNLEINDNNTNALYVGDIADIPPVINYYLDLYNCSNVTGDITNIRPSYYASFYNCSKVTGDITNIRPSYYASFAYCTNVTGTLNPQATLQYINLTGTGLNTTQLDNSIIAVNAVTTVVGTFNWSTGVRSVTSDTAYDALDTAGWTLTAREW